MEWHVIGSTGQWKCKMCPYSDPLGARISDLYRMDGGSTFDTCPPCDADAAPGDTSGRSGRVPPAFDFARAPSARRARGRPRIQGPLEFGQVGRCACPHGYGRCRTEVYPGDYGLCDFCWDESYECDCDCEGCTARPLSPRDATRNGPPTSWAICARADCTCTASWNGARGEYCCITCRDGTPCAFNRHARPSHYFAPRADFPAWV